MFNTTILKLKIIFPTLVLMGLLGMSPARAAVITVENNSTVPADISASDATRIAVVDDRITLIRGSAGAYIASNDTTQGAVFIQPKLPANHSICKTVKEKSALKNSNKKRRNKKQCFPQTRPASPFYLFVSTEKNHNYVLRLTPKPNQAADLLTLKPLEVEKAAALAWETSDTYSQTLIRLVAAILRGQMPKGYTLMRLNQDFSWGSQIALHLSQRLTGAQLIAEFYQVVNHSRRVITLTEPAFYQSGDRAIFFKKASLAPGESTDLIKVRSDAHE